MPASLSIHQIASALALPKTRQLAHSSQRILCLNLQQNLSLNDKSKSAAKSHRDNLKFIAEGFLKFSPRVQCREPGWIFIDIASTSHFFRARPDDTMASHAKALNHVNNGDCINKNTNVKSNIQEFGQSGEAGLLRSALSLVNDLGHQAICAIADTASGAQAFAAAHGRFICPPGEEKAHLKALPLSQLIHLEGLLPWTQPSRVDSIITFLQTLGFQTIGDLSRLNASSVQERWGETGALLWQRVLAQDRQPISPLLPTEPLEDYVHLDFPISLVSLLLHQLQKSLDFLFARLQGRRLFARKLIVTLHCEYSNARHRVEIEPNTPSRNVELFATLLENKLSNLSLENPIRDFELQAMACAEKTRQLDFFEPRESDREKILTLFSLLSQSAVKPGFFRITPSIRPEGGWNIADEPEQLSPQHTAWRTRELSGSEPPSIAPTPSYGEAVMSAPRPTRVLKEPAPLTIEELQKLKILTTHPIERLEDEWWKTPDLAMKRDYYFAVSSTGQCIWIYQDLRTGQHFVHGYFD